MFRVFLRQMLNLRKKLMEMLVTFMKPVMLFFNLEWVAGLGKNKSDEILPESVNYHFTRQCNYKCGFCFHTAITSFVLPREKALEGLRLLKLAGMLKINFSGGEPFIHERGRFVGDMAKFCKLTLHLNSVTIVSNGSLITEKWFKDYGKYLDILAVSCDSFDEDVNKTIGRYNSKKEHIAQLHRIRGWCCEYRVAFKLNTVVNTYNIDEDFTENVMALNPCRWKVFQCLVIEGENQGPEAIRNAEEFVVTDGAFKAFVSRHSSVPCLVPESNETMRNSYIILDEYMRFLDNTSGKKIPSKSILDVGVSEALKFSGFDAESFKQRGGKYKWSKKELGLEW